MSESSVCTKVGTGQPADLPAEIVEKLTKTSYDNDKWHTDVDKEDPTAITCKISQTQYLFQK